MTVSSPGMADIVSHEAIVPYRYRDSRGIDTDGIGNTKAAGDHDPAMRPFGVEMPLKEIIGTFRRNVARFDARVRKAVTVPMRQHEEDALAGFDLNTGGIFRATITRRLNAGDRAGAAVAFMSWVKPPEIRGRRLAEQKLFRDGTYSSGGMANVYPADGRGRILWKQGKRINVLPMIESIVGADAAEDAAKKAARKAGGAAGGTLASGSGSTQAPDLGQLPSDAGSLQIVLIGLAIVLGVVAVAFLVQWLKHRAEARTHVDAAAKSLAAAIAAAPEGSAGPPHNQSEERP